MRRHRLLHLFVCKFVIAASIVTLMATGSSALAQGTGGPSVGDSRVGYIDDAIPGTLFRLRYDSTYNDRRPTRAEFIWARAGSADAPGPTDKEPSLDYQEFTAYLEAACNERLSAFVEVPYRLVNPTVDPNERGIADLNAGFKYAFLYGPDRVATFQLRTFIPNGDAKRGMGNDHFTLEPALLVYQALASGVTLEGELRAWVPIDGTEFAGTIIRYGLGVSCTAYETCTCRLAPVVEVVGWTVLDGRQSVVPTEATAFVEDAAGDTIVNLKIGARLQVNHHADFYVGYGRPLTGDRWYENTLRAELRFAF